MEWSQNIQQLQWREARVIEELDRKMRHADQAVADLAQHEKQDLRTAAFVLAIRRVARAATYRQAIRQYLPRSLLD